MKVNYLKKKMIKFFYFILKSEFQEPKKSNDQVYGFRSEVVSGPKSNASFRKIFENENAFTLEKKPVTANKALKIPEEKITQIMSIKEVNTFNLFPPIDFIIFILFSSVLLNAL